MWKHFAPVYSNIQLVEWSKPAPSVSAVPQWYQGNLASFLGRDQWLCSRSEWLIWFYCICTTLAFSQHRHNWFLSLLPIQPRLRRWPSFWRKINKPDGHLAQPSGALSHEEWFQVQLPVLPAGQGGGSVGMVCRSLWKISIFVNGFCLCCQSFLPVSPAPWWYLGNLASFPAGVQWISLSLWVCLRSVVHHSRAKVLQQRILGRGHQSIHSSLSSTLAWCVVVGQAKPYSVHSLMTVKSSMGSFEFRLFC